MRWLSRDESPGVCVAGGYRCRQGVTAARPDSGRRARRWRTAQRMQRSRSAAQGCGAAAVRESVAAADDQLRPTLTTSDDQPGCNGGEQRRGSPAATPTSTRDLTPLSSVSLPLPLSSELHHQPRRPASPSDALRRCGRWAPTDAATRPRIRRALRRGDDAQTCNNATLPSVRPPIEKKAPRSGANRARVRHAEPRGGGSGGFADAAERGAERKPEPANNCDGWSDAGHARESGLALPASLRGRASLMLCSAARSATADVRQLALMR